MSCKGLRKRVKKKCDRHVKLVHKTKKKNTKRRKKPRETRLPTIGNFDENRAELEDYTNLFGA